MPFVRIATQPNGWKDYEPLPCLQVQYPSIARLSRRRVALLLALSRIMQRSEFVPTDGGHCRPDVVNFPRDPRCLKVVE